MRIEYTHLIPENIAPKGATRIVVMKMDENGNPVKEVCSIPAARFGGLTPPEGKPAYRFIVTSDPHLNTSIYTDRTEGYKSVLTYANQDEDCKFTVVCGDLVDNGLVQDQTDNYCAVVKSTAQKPVYAIAGNHDTIWGYPTDEHMESYTVDCTGHGYPHYYAVAHTADKANRVYGNADVTEGDLLIFLGHYGKDHSGGGGDWRGGEQFSADELAWFESVMAANQDKRRMIFIHPYIPDTAGDPPLTITPPNEPPDLWTKKSTITTDAGADFLQILDRYPGALVINGHSHYRFRTQEEQSTAIVYKPPSGNYIIIHSPSPNKLRDVRSGKRRDLIPTDADYGGEGFIVDVYDDCTYFRGRDFVNHVWVGIGTYLIRR